MKNFLEKNAEYFYLVFRVIIGIIFLLHGIQKLPGILNGSTALASLFGLAGVIEVIGGVLIILGLFARYVTLVTSVEMLVAYFTVHIPGGLNPLANQGEAALLFFASFLVILAYGPGKYSLGHWMKK